MNNKIYKKWWFCLIITVIALLIISMFNNTYINEERNNITENATSDNNTDIKQENISVVDTFINKYNLNNNSKITNIIDIPDIQNKESEYYRVEFRLGAFKNSICKHALIDNESTIDIINYNLDTISSDQYGKFRIYVNSSNYNGMKSILKSSINIINKNISDEDINNIHNSFDSTGNNSFLLGENNYISVYFTKSEFMIDIEKVKFID